jgi:hypothetical protein
MASTYSTNLKIELIGTAEQAGIWGVTTNTNLGTALEQAIVGKADVTMSSTTVTLTLTNANTAQDARAIYLNLTGSPGGAAVLEVPAIEKPYIVKNGSDQQVTIKVSGQTGVPIPTTKTALVYNNGTDVVTAIDFIPSLVLGAALPVASGGTGQTSYTNGQLLIGNTSGNTLTKATLTAGTGISVTDGTGSITIAATNNGTVTSVSGTGTVQGLSLSGTVTSSGNLTLGGSLSAVNLASQVTGTLPVANGGTGAASLTTNNVLIGNGTSAVQFVAPGDSGNILTSNGTTWTSAAPSGGGSAVGSTLYLNNVYGGF